MKRIITIEGKDLEIGEELYQELKEASTARKRWRAEDGEEYCYNISGKKPHLDIERNHELDTDLYNMGNYYQTSELAGKARGRQLALVRLRDYALENMPFEPDWEDLNSKHFVTYDHIRKQFHNDVYRNLQEQSELPCFKTSKDCRKFIEDNEQDLKIVFNIKE